MVSQARLCLPSLGMGFLRRVLPAYSVHSDTPSLGVGGAQLAGSGVGLGCYSDAQPCRALVRDGGLKREKVKDTFKEEQQKLYSKMIVGNHEDRSRS